MVVTQEPYKQIIINDQQTRVEKYSTPVIEEMKDEPLIEMDHDPWKPDGKAAAAAVKEPIPLGPGAGPLRCPEMDHKKQLKKERRMEHIDRWIQEEKKDYNRLFKEVSESPDDLTRTFSKDVKLAKMDRSKRKQEMLTIMFQDTSKDTTRYYADNPEKEFDGEFHLAWGNVGGGVEHDKRVNEEYEKQGIRLKQALESEQIWRDCSTSSATRDCTDENLNTWETVQQPQFSRPPPNSPPF